MATVNTINDLPALGRTPTSGDKLALQPQGDNTKSIDYDALATAIINKLGGDPVTVAHGGFGGTTTAQARTNLSVYSKAETDNAIQQSTADNTWTPTTLGMLDYGTLYAYKNNFLKLVIIRWYGNSTRPTSTTTSVNLPASLKPAAGQIVPMKGGVSIEARTDSTVRLTFASELNTWTGGQVVYYTAT